MSEDLLYYDNINQSFSLKGKDSNEKVVLDLEVLLLWKGNANIPPVEINNIKIQLYPLHHKDVIVDIYVDGVLLLPISLMYRRKGHFGENEIAFSQYGQGRNAKMSAHSIVINKDFTNLDCLERTELLILIRDMCNCFQEYLQNEATKLIEKLKKEEPINWMSLETVISILYKYAPLAPELKQLLCPFIDKYCFDNLREYLDFLSHNIHRGNNYAHLIKHGDSLWQYIKDYKLL